MLTYLSSSIWASPAQTLVNTVNVVGAMGKGIALEFKRGYPEMYRRYRELCEAKEFKVGMLWLYKARDRLKFQPNTYVCSGMTCICTRCCPQRKLPGGLPRSTPLYFLC